MLARQWKKLNLALFRQEIIPLLELKEDQAGLRRFDELYARLRRRLG